MAVAVRRKIRHVTGDRVLPIIAVDKARSILFILLRLGLPLPRGAAQLDCSPAHRPYEHLTVKCKRN